MKQSHWICLSLSLVACLTILGHDPAFGIGGRGGGGFGGGGRGGGGGGFGGGGGGMARPSGGGGARPSIGSSPAMSRPSGGGARPSQGALNRPGAQPGTRPNVGSGAANRPGLQPGTRPSIGASAGNRPGLQPGTRPSIGGGPGLGNRPSTLPSGRPGIGSGQGIGSGAGIANRPATGAGIGGAGRPGISQQPARLPGLGQATAGSRLPKQGAGIQDRAANRSQSVQDRQANLSDRMATGREDWQQNRGDRQDDRQDWRDQNREDWQDFADDHHDHHGDWYHDSWEPGDHWNYMWDNYPVAAAFGVTAWGVNRLANGMGYSDYSNPYSEEGGGSGGYDYSEPLVSYAEPESARAETAPTTDAAASATDPGMQAFDDARTAFAAGDAEKALTLLDTTLKTMPRDTVVHEFRSLVLFALKRYPESAAALYAVLSAGPGWDWTTMIGLYSNAEMYTQQLRALEAFAKANSKSADAHFLLGYHYLTGTHAPAASDQFKLAQAQLPDDKLITQLIGMTTPADATPKPESSAPAQQLILPESEVLTVEKMVGTWKASNKSSKFQLELAKDGQFVWSFTRGKDKQSVKGAFAVDQNNLAMEPDAGGTMLAVIDFSSPTQFNFRMIGGDAKDPGLEFKQEK